MLWGASHAPAYELPPDPSALSALMVQVLRASAFAYGLVYGSWKLSSLKVRALAWGLALLLCSAVSAAEKDSCWHLLAN